LIGDHALQLPVLLLESAQALGVAQLHAAILPPPAIERLARNAVADHFAGLARPLGLLQDRDYAPRRGTLAVSAVS
jgi:hypothetical protein